MGSEKIASPEFTFSPTDFKSAVELWHKEGWPVQLLMRDHYSAKILQDNDVFNLVKHFKHEWKWDEEEGLLLLHKRQDELVWTKWDDLLSNLTVRVNKRGEFKFDGASYGVDGLEYEFSFQFSPSEFKGQLDQWARDGWPVKLLLRDHYAAKVLYDNMVFPLIEFYGHEWRWDDEVGFSLLFKETPTSAAEFTPWTKIAGLVPVQRTPQGWLLFDGWNYTQEGLVPIHLWQWKELSPSYVFAPGSRPKFCYLDIVSFCWEHEGMQGFGIRTPHGHLALEFADEEGNFYSVGQYMDPRSKINTKVVPAATVRAVLMSPDPYMASKGEKTVHRYLIGSGEEGRGKFARLKRHIEEIQDWRKSPETGIVTTCASRKYHMLNSNCGDFCSDIETFVQEELGAQLVKIEDDEVFVPYRHKVVSKEGWLADLWTNLWNRFILFLVDCLLFFAISTPWLAKKIGANLQDDFNDPYFKADSQKPGGGGGKGSGRMLQSLLRSFKPKPIRFPVRVRVEQLYSPRLKKFSAKLKT